LLQSSDVAHSLERGRALGVATGALLGLVALVYPPAELAIAGGVAANGVLRERVGAWGRERGVTVRLPEKRYCTDNAAMIAFAGLQRQAEATDPRRVPARSRIG